MKASNAVGLVSIGVPYFDAPTAEAYLKETRALLERRWTVYGPDKMITDKPALEETIERFLTQERVDVLIIQIGTFPDGEAPLTLAERLRVPIIVHSLPEPDLAQEVGLNSFCGANLTTYTLTAMDYPHTSLHGDPRRAEVLEALEAQVRAALALADMKRSRLGLVGFRAPGFYPCVFDELLLRRQLGMALDYIDLDAVKQAFQTGRRKQAPQQRFLTTDGGELPAQAIAWMEQHYAALTEVLANNEFDLFAVRDWPELFDVDAPGGVWPALGWLLDDGYLLAPEGDVNSAVTMKLAHNLTGGIPFFADISAWEDADSTLLLWHYGGAPSLARNAEEIRFGREGREVQFTLKPGKATLMRLGLYRNAFRLLAVAGEVQDEPVTIRRTGAKVQTLNTPVGQVIRTILDQGWEHHYVLIYGDVIPELQAVSRYTGIPLEVL